MLDHWILDGDGRPHRVDLMTWARWFEQHSNRQQFETMVDHVRVSTIFLGVDHGFGHSATPILWETMAFADDGEDHSPIQERCGGSREQAEEMHRRVVEQVRVALGFPAEG